MPLSLDGSQRGQAERVQEFIRHLTQHSVIPVDTWDERLSTVSAEKALVEGGVKRGKRKLLRDTLAATLILQGYLERLRFR
jgi:putative Holliday junction resolvase